MSVRWRQSSLSFVVGCVATLLVHHVLWGAGPATADYRVARLEAEVARRRREAERATAELKRRRGEQGAMSSTSQSPPHPPGRLPSKEELLRRVSERHGCAKAVETAQNTSRSTFNADYSQDWYAYMNWFHDLGRPGFYLDVGANDPRVLSNTWFFDACLGWKGICVEPSAFHTRDLKLQRTCKVYQVCADAENRVRRMEGAMHVTAHLLPTNTTHGASVPCMAVSDILRKEGVTHVDFMSLDVEGSELLAIAGLPHEDDVTIDVIVMENDKGDGDMIRWPLFVRGYAMVNALESDDVFVRTDEPRFWGRRFIPPRSVHPNERLRKRREIRHKYGRNLSTTLLRDIRL